MQNAFGQPQSVLVLGGTSDIALAVTRRLVNDRTTTVVLAGRDDAALARSADELRAHGAKLVETVVFDAADLAERGPDHRCRVRGGGRVHRSRAGGGGALGRPGQARR